MAEKTNTCPQCAREIMPSVSNRCMYCGADLPEAFRLNGEQKSALLKEKLESFRETEENAGHVITQMRQDLGMKPGRRSRRERRKDNAQALSEALASIQVHIDRDSDDEPLH